MKNYYEILEINEDASKEQIKEAYRRLAQKYHPDRNKNENAAELFKDINEAKQVLSDDKKKSEYDLFLIDYLLANDFSANKKTFQNQENHSSEKKQHKKFIIEKRFTWIIAFIAIVVLAVVYFLLSAYSDKTAVMARKGNTIILGKAEPIFKENSIKKSSAVIKSKEVISERIGSQKEIKIRVKKNLSHLAMIQILNSINAKKNKLSIKINCIKIYKTNTSNVENAFEIARFLQSEKFVISGREIIDIDSKGIKIAISGSCIKLTIGSI